MLHVINSKKKKKTKTKTKTVASTNIFCNNETLLKRLLWRLASLWPWALVFASTSSSLQKRRFSLCLLGFFFFFPQNLYMLTDTTLFLAHGFFTIKKHNKKTITKPFKAPKHYNCSFIHFCF